MPFGVDLECHLEKCRKNENCRSYLKLRYYSKVAIACWAQLAETLGLIIGDLGYAWNICKYMPDLAALFTHTLSMLAAALRLCAFAGILEIRRKPLQKRINIELWMISEEA